jgi:hypothetical protein
VSPGGGIPPASFSLLQPSAEKIAEQVVEAIPAALLVQGDQEQVRALEFLKHVLAGREVPTPRRSHAQFGNGLMRIQGFDQEEVVAVTPT